MSEFNKIAVMNLQEAKDFQTMLKDKGIEVVLNHDDQTCTRGCAVTVELHGRDADLEKIQEAYTESYQKLLDGLEYDPEVVNSVFDTSQGEATCPACGHQFATTNAECPDCGLVLG